MKPLGILACFSLLFSVYASESSIKIDYFEGAAPKTDDEIKSSEEEKSDNHLLEFMMLNDSVDIFFVQNTQLYRDSWNELAQPYFWKTIIGMSPDSCVINIGETRQIIEIMTVKEWEAKNDTEKSKYRDSIRAAYSLSEDYSIYMTIGKSDFYHYDDILPAISRGVQRFNEQGVDPWYAQSILMIESPGKLAKSNAGAYGSFQLMAEVARKFGLKVNRYVDERKDFDKSAVAASQLIKTICIPEAKKILDARNIEYNETDLWFRLFVMHIYHAGAYNVAAVVNKINPSNGGMELIQEMWVTKAGRFGNASQNYSQITLAVMMILDNMLGNCYDDAASL